MDVSWKSYPGIRGSRHGVWPVSCFIIGTAITMYTLQRITRWVPNRKPIDTLLNKMTWLQSVHHFTTYMTAPHMDSPQDMTTTTISRCTYYITTSSLLLLLLLLLLLIQTKTAKVMGFKASKEITAACGLLCPFGPADFSVLSITLPNDGGRSRSPHWLVE